MQIQHSNPMICDYENGVCELPSFAESEIAASHTLDVKDKPVKVIYFTDPICSSCWGIEPQLRKLKLEYGEEIDIEYHMGGLLKDWTYNSGGISKPSDVAHHWDEVSKYYDMPIDGNVWLEDPLHSSYPPSIAFKAAQLQDEKKALQFLRRIREMVFLEKKNITRWEHLELAAKETGLDILQFKADYESRATELFQQDLQLARDLGVRSFPTLLFKGPDGNTIPVLGVKPYDRFESTLHAVYPDAEKKKIDIKPESLFEHYPTLTLKEYAVLASITRSQAESKLNELIARQMVNKTETRNGDLWRIRK